METMVVWKRHVEKACIDTEVWHPPGGSHLVIALSLRNVHCPGFRRSVRRALSDAYQVLCLRRRLSIFCTVGHCIFRGIWSRNPARTLWRRAQRLCTLLATQHWHWNGAGATERGLMLPAEAVKELLL